MTKIAYINKTFRQSTLVRIAQVNEIIKEYLSQGYTLTLRQAYYQLVSRDLIPNTIKSYKALGSIINDGRLAGLIDWNAIEDRTRNLHELDNWADPENIMRDAARWYRTDKWSSQADRIEVWIEKEALAGVFEKICDELEIPFFACRGYTSQSEMWRASLRLISWERQGFNTTILHFGDHDPSGIDMSRDIVDRLRLFGTSVDVRRLALNMDQINQYNPPPNPAKVTDSRYASYQEEYGDESWELDALEPQILEALVREAVEDMRDDGDWYHRLAGQEGERTQLQEAANNWYHVISLMDEYGLL